MVLRYLSQLHVLADQRDVSRMQIILIGRGSGIPFYFCY